MDLAQRASDGRSPGSDPDQRILAAKLSQPAAGGGRYSSDPAVLNDSADPARLAQSGTRQRLIEEDFPDPGGCAGCGSGNRLYSAQRSQPAAGGNRRTGELVGLIQRADTGRYARRAAC